RRRDHLWLTQQARRQLQLELLPLRVPDDGKRARRLSVDGHIVPCAVQLNLVAARLVVVARRACGEIGRAREIRRTQRTDETRQQIEAHALPLRAQVEAFALDVERAVGLQRAT